MRGQEKLYNVLKDLSIDFDYYEHKAAPTIELAMENWKNIDSTHCKNLFFRNHKGKKHYLVILRHDKQLNIKILESKLKQGKLSFASEKRMDKYLGLKPGSVSPFGLVNDAETHVYLFIDSDLQKAERLSFHPNDNTASLVIEYNDFIKFLKHCGNNYEFIEI